MIVDYYTRPLLYTNKGKTTIPIKSLRCCPTLNTNRDWTKGTLQFIQRIYIRISSDAYCKSISMYVLGSLKKCVDNAVSEMHNWKDICNRIPYRQNIHEHVCHLTWSRILIIFDSKTIGYITNEHSTVNTKRHVEAQFIFFKNGLFNIHTYAALISPTMEIGKFSFISKHPITKQTHQFLLLLILNIRYISNNYTLSLIQFL